MKEDSVTVKTLTEQIKDDDLDLGTQNMMD